MGFSARLLGRLYQLRLNPGDLTKWATLTVVYNADAIIAAGGDIAVSPDNIETSTEYLMINEDGTGESRQLMGAKGRDGSVWRFSLKGDPGRALVDVSSATRVAELAPPGRDGIAVNPPGQGGIWETSGIIDMSRFFGPN